MIGSPESGLPFQTKKSQKGTENYDENNGKKTGSKKKPGENFKENDGLSEEKAEQMVSRKRMNHHMIRKG